MLGLSWLCCHHQQSTTACMLDLGLESMFFFVLLVSQLYCMRTAGPVWDLWPLFARVQALVGMIMYHQGSGSVPMLADWVTLGSGL